MTELNDFISTIDTLKVEYLGRFNHIMEALAKIEVLKTKQNELISDALKVIHNILSSLLFEHHDSREHGMTTSDYDTQVERLRAISELSEDILEK